MSKTQSKYAKKRSSGKMMYGPSKKVPKWPDFVSKNPPSNQYWWGEPKPTNRKGLYID